MASSHTHSQTDNENQSQNQSILRSRSSHNRTAKVVCDLTFLVWTLAVGIAGLDMPCILCRPIGSAGNPSALRGISAWLRVGSCCRHAGPFECIEQLVMTRNEAEVYLAQYRSNAEGVLRNDMKKSILQQLDFWVCTHTVQGVSYCWASTLTV